MSQVPNFPQILSMLELNSVETFHSIVVGVQKRKIKCCKIMIKLEAFVLPHIPFGSLFKGPSRLLWSLICCEL